MEIERSRKSKTVNASFISHLSPEVIPETDNPENGKTMLREILVQSLKGGDCSCSSNLALLEVRKIELCMSLATGAAKLKILLCGKDTG